LVASLFSPAYPQLFKITIYLIFSELGMPFALKIGTPYDTAPKPWRTIMAKHQFCTPEWLEEIARIYKASPDDKNKLKKLTAKICYRVKSNPDWGISEDIIFGAFFDHGQLMTLNFFTEKDAFQEAEYLLAATSRTWKKILRRKRDFVTDFMLGKIKLELGTKVKMLELALHGNNIFDFLTQVDLQFPDEMSADELKNYRSKIQTLLRVRAPPLKYIKI
jgi:putative sterol carrier protein